MNEFPNLALANRPAADAWAPTAARRCLRDGIFRRTINSTRCMPDHVVTDKATFYPSAIRTYAPGTRHTATGFYNLVISSNRCDRNHGYVKSRVRPIRGLKSFKCATRLFPALGALRVGGGDFVRVPPIAAPSTGAPASRPLSLAWAGPCRTRRAQRGGPDCVGASGPTPCRRTGHRAVRCSRSSPQRHRLLDVADTLPRPLPSTTSVGIG
jgi:hypothetical protein